MSTQTLTIIGNVASGKSTLMPILVKALKAYPVDADDLFQTSDPFAKPYLADMKRWAFANETWLTMERIKILRGELRKKKQKLTIIDSGLLMSWVYTYSHLLVGNITEDEWSLYHTLYDELTDGLFANTHVVKLSYSMDTLMERLKKRGRDYELAFYTREYLGQLELGLSALYEKLLQKNVKVIEVTEEFVSDFENNQDDCSKIISHISAQLKG
ncbi:MAG: deoxynucleoside kinase [Candidatus Woesebacteria bacterium]